MKLTEEQEEKVRHAIDVGGLKMTTLRDDVLDHLCCVLETRIRKGQSFEALLQEAIAELAPNGLEELESQTVFLLNIKRIRIMKKLIYLIGFIGAVTLTVGVTFKLLNYGGAYELFSIGLFVLLLIFIPLMTIDHYKVAISKALSERMKFVLGGIASIVTGLSVVFKLLHLQGAEFLLLLGAFIFAVGFLPFLFFTMYKKSIA